MSGIILSKFVKTRDSLIDKIKMCYQRFVYWSQMSWRQFLTKCFQNDKTSRKGESIVRPSHSSWNFPSNSKSWNKLTNIDLTSIEILYAKILKFLLEICWRKVTWNVTDKSKFAVKNKAWNYKTFLVTEK